MEGGWDKVLAQKKTAIAALDAEGNEPAPKKSKEELVKYFQIFKDCAVERNGGEKEDATLKETIFRKDGVIQTDEEKSQTTTAEDQIQYEKDLHELAQFG